MQVHQPELVGIVVASLGASELPPGRLVLEVTETALLEDSGCVGDTLDRLRGVGVNLSLDDFGTGYSSLNHLHRFPFNEIKLDGSFVRGLDQSRRAGAIVDAVAGLARALGLATVAEGVETPANLKRVAQAGYTAVQGFLLARPMSNQRFAALLARDPAFAVALSLPLAG